MTIMMFDQDRLFLVNENHTDLIMTNKLRFYRKGDCAVRDRGIGVPVIVRPLGFVNLNLYKCLTYSVCG